MTSTRRDLMLGAAVAMMPAPGRAVHSAPPRRRPIWIDGLGWPFDPEGKATPRLAVTRDWIAAMHASGVTAWLATVGRNQNDEAAFEKSIAVIADWEAWLDINRAYARKATTAADIRRAADEGRIAIVYGFQNSDMIGTDLDRVSLFQRLGVRAMQLTYNTRTLAGDGALEAGDGGLSRFGAALIRRLEAEQVLVDLSHGGPRMMADAAAAATRPPLLSHTGCRALVDHPRNASDAVIRAVADKGGVTGIYLSPFLSPHAVATRAGVVRHIAHAVSIAGEDHVGIGSDGGLEAEPLDDAYMAQIREDNRRQRLAGIAAPFEENPDFVPLVRDYNDPRRFQLIASDLGGLGWPARRIDKVLGGNLLRLYGDVWGG